MITAFQATGSGSVRPPGSAETDRVSVGRFQSLPIAFQALFTNAVPSMTPPAVPSFHSATSSLRASATMVVFSHGEVQVKGLRFNR